MCVCVHVIRYSGWWTKYSKHFKVFIQFNVVTYGNVWECVRTCVCWLLPLWVCPLWMSALLILLGGDCCQSATLNGTLLREKPLRGLHSSCWGFWCKRWKNEPDSLLISFGKFSFSQLWGIQCVARRDTPSFLNISLLVQLPIKWTQGRICPSKLFFFFQFIIHCVTAPTDLTFKDKTKLLAIKSH